EARVVDGLAGWELDMDPQVAVGPDGGPALDLDVGAAHAPFAADLEVPVVVVGLGAVELELAVAGEGCDGGEELLAGAADLGVGEGHLAANRSVAAVVG